MIGKPSDEAADPATPHLVPGAEVGLLGIDLSTRRRNRANGFILSRDAGGSPSRSNRASATARDTSSGASPSRSRVPEPTEKLGSLDAAARALITAADTPFVASRSRAGLEGGGTDISHRGGRPGFVRIDGDGLTVPDFSGDRYLNTLGNLFGESRASLLIPDFANGDLLVRRGVVAIDWTAVEGFAGALRAWRLSVTGGRRRRGTLPFRWSDPEPAPQIARRDDRPAAA